MSNLDQAFYNLLTSEGRQFGWVLIRKGQMGLVISLAQRRHLDVGPIRGGVISLSEVLHEPQNIPVSEPSERTAPPGQTVWLAVVASIALWAMIARTIQLLWQFAEL